MTTLHCTAAMHAVAASPTMMMHDLMPDWWYRLQHKCSASDAIGSRAGAGPLLRILFEVGHRRQLLCSAVPCHKPDLLGTQGQGQNRQACKAFCSRYVSQSLMT